MVVVHDDGDRRVPLRAERDENAGGDEAEAQRGGEQNEAKRAPARAREACGDLGHRNPFLGGFRR